MNFLNSFVILIAAVLSYSFYSGFWLRFDFAINFLKTIIIIIIIINFIITSDTAKRKSTITADS